MQPRVWMWWDGGRGGQVTGLPSTDSQASLLGVTGGGRAPYVLQAGSGTPHPSYLCTMLTD